MHCPVLLYPLPSYIHYSCSYLLVSLDQLVLSQELSSIFPPELFSARLVCFPLTSCDVLSPLPGESNQEVLRIISGLYSVHVH